MEVTGLVVGIVGLYSTCQSCFSLYSEVSGAEHNAKLAAKQLDVHASILKAWAFNWEIRPNLSSLSSSKDDDEEGDKKKCEKLKRYLERNPYKGQGIVSALSCIGDILSDKMGLLETYGLEVDLDDGEASAVGCE